MQKLYRCRFVTYTCIYVNNHTVYFIYYIIIDISIKWQLYEFYVGIWNLFVIKNTYYVYLLKIVYIRNHLFI